MKNVFARLLISRISRFVPIFQNRTVVILPS